jgi:hypothetical protein
VQELGDVITKLDQMCPSALEKTDGKDEIQVNIDAIDPKTFHSLNSLVKVRHMGICLLVSYFINYSYM